MTAIALHLAAAIAAQGVGAAAPAAPTDFRTYVFGAYGAVLGLLLLFTLWSVRQVAAAGRKVERLERRLDIESRQSTVDSRQDGGA
jgi:hypothetical protein